MKVSDKVFIKKEVDKKVYTIHSHTVLRDKDNLEKVINEYYNLSMKGEIIKKDFFKKDLEVFKAEYTPESISKLKSNEIFVFGSNTQGRHGAGAARVAIEKFGAIYGQAEGLQGNSYGLITTNLDPMSSKYPLESIYQNILKLIEFARQNPSLKFYVTKVGTNLAGYSITEIREQFIRCINFITIPYNVVLPKEFEMRW